MFRLMLTCVLGLFLALGLIWHADSQQPYAPVMPVPAAGNYTDCSVLVTKFGTQVLPALSAIPGSPVRRKIVLFNNSPAQIWFSFTTATPGASSIGSIMLAPGSSSSPSTGSLWTTNDDVFMTQQALNAIAAVDGSALTCWVY